MEHNIEKVDARSRILTSAAKIFAEKSFDGARVDEIAKDAEVPKSLIYYHFKSKNEIFQVLTENLIDEYKTIINRYREESQKQKGEQIKARMMQVYYQFGMEHADLVRAVFMDSLKNTNANTVFFKMVRSLIDSDDELNITQKEYLINEFFTSFIPSLAYICFADKWVTYFEVERKEFDQMFLRAYDGSHGAYHRNQ